MTEKRMGGEESRQFNVFPWEWDGRVPQFSCVLSWTIVRNWGWWIWSSLWWIYHCQWNQCHSTSKHWMQTYVEEEELVIAPLIDARTQPGGVTCSKIYVMSVIICSNFIVGPLCYIILLPVHSAVFGSGKRQPTGLLERLARMKKGGLHCHSLLFQPTWYQSGNWIGDT